MKNPWDIEDNSKNSNNFDKETQKKLQEEFLKKIFEKVDKEQQKSIHFRKFNKNHIKFSSGLILILVSIFLIFWLSSGVYKVNSDENGIVLYFGKYYETTTPGLHFYIPAPIGKLEKIAIARINKEEFGFSSASQTKKAFDEESLMLTGDENIVDIDFEVQWKIGNVKNYLFNIKNPKKTIRSATESVIREIIANRDTDDILANKKLEIELEAKKLLQNILNSYNSGIGIITVQLLRADPPKEVINAFRDVQTAKADKERKINEAQSYSNDIMPKARGEAEALLQQAEAYKKAVISKAEGETARFDKIYNEYKNSKDITKKRIYIETMEELIKNNEKVIVDKDVGGNLIQMLNK